MPDLTHATRRALQHLTASGTARRATIPAPILGLNTLDPESAMDPSYAIELTNMFPQLGRITSRRGCEEYADIAGESGEIGTLAAHRSGSIDRFYAFSPTALYDVSDPDAVSEVTDAAVSVSNNRWRTAAIGSSFIAVNGDDPPIRITAGAPAAHGWSGTGLTPSDLTGVIAHHNRLFFVEKDSPKLWYGELNAVTGSLASIDLGLVVSRGGNVAAIGSVTLDSGSGVDDLLAVFLTRGQVLLYAGTDPSDADSWRIAGVFDIGPVVGPRPLVKRGGDLIAITVDGFIPLLQFLHSGRQQSGLAVSEKIAPSVRADVEHYGDEPGWQGVLHAPSNWMLFNVPQGGHRAVQYVANAQTGAWCRFDGMNAACWESRGDELYYGAAGGKVIRADVGGNDCGESVHARVRSAYSYLGSPYSKHFKMIRAYTESTGGGQQVAVGASVDFTRVLPVLQDAELTQAGPSWGATTGAAPGASLWNTSHWGSGVTRYRAWRSMAKIGTCIAVHLGLNLSGSSVSLHATDVLYDQVQGAV